MKIPQLASRRRVLYLIVEVAIYALLVSIYLGLVLYFATGWLKELFMQQPAAYAFVSVALMALQSVGLEKLTSMLVSSNRRSRS